MSRGQRRPRDAAGVSSFPFLAVLLCTVGALIVLLVVIARRAEVQARETQRMALAERSRQDQERQQAQLAQQDSFDEQARGLRSQADAVAAALAHKQQTAAQLQAEVEEAERRLRQLQEQHRDLQRSAGERPSDHPLRRQLADLEERLRQARAILGDRQRAAAAPPQELYSIIPYAGRNGAARRPIYIECLGDRVVIQPEGTELIDTDFEVLGPGNPLEAAVRATIVYWNQAGRSDVSNAYPLLLVRPDGVSAYEAAHSALRTWGREFGYEVVQEDWKLAYPPADPELAEQQRAAIALARDHMQTVAETRQRLRRSATAFQIGVDGTLERAGGFADDDDEGVNRRPTAGASAGIARARGAGHGGPDPYGTGGGGTTASRIATGRDGAATQPSGTEAGSFFGHGKPGGDDALGSRFAASRAQSLPRRPQGGTGTPGGGPLSGSGLGGAALGGGQGPDVGASNRRGNSSDPFAGIGSQLDRLRGIDRQPGSAAANAAGAEAAGGTAQGIAAGREARGPNDRGPGGQSASEGGPAGPPGTPGGSGPSGPGGPSMVPHGGNSMTAGGNGMTAGGPGGDQPSPGGMPEDSAGSMSFSATAPVTPIANKEGANWALPMKPSRGSSPLRRDVHLLVDESAITVFVDPRTAQTLQIIRLGPDPTESVGELKDAIWKVMKDWGNPPAGFHWRPVLRTQVAARGSARYAQLNTLLDDSGFELGR